MKRGPPTAGRGTAAKVALGGRRKVAECDHGGSLVVLEILKQWGTFYSYITVFIVNKHEMLGINMIMN